MERWIDCRQRHYPLPNAPADAARERARSARGVRLHVARSVPPRATGPDRRLRQPDADAWHPDDPIFKLK